MKILRIRKKPVEVEAIEWTGKNYEDVCIFSERILRKNKDDKLLIPTLEGTMKAPIGYYIIKGVEKELYAIAPEPFIKTYEILE